MKINVKTYLASKKEFMRFVNSKRVSIEIASEGAVYLGLPTVVALYFLGEQIGFGDALMDRIEYLNKEYDSILTGTGNEYELALRVRGRGTRNE